MSTHSTAFEYLYNSPIDRDDVRSLLERVPDCVTQRSPRNNTLLHVVIESSQDAELAEEIVQRGADVNARRDDGFTPLHSWADENLVRRIGAMLIDAGSDVNAKENRRLTPMALLARRSRPRAVRSARMLRRRGGYVDMNTALCLGWTDDVRSMLERDPGIDLKRRSELIPFPESLMKDAVWSNSAEIVQDLINRGAHVDTPGFHGVTALETAVWNPWVCEEVVPMLIKAGANPLARPTTGEESMLEYAIRHRAPQSVIECLEQETRRRSG